MSTDHAALAMLTLLHSLQSRLPTAARINILFDQRVVEVRAGDYLDARAWCTAFGGPAELDREIRPEAGLVWWHTCITLGDWWVRVNTRETLPLSIPLHSPTGGEDGFDDTATAMVDALEILAWSLWLDRAKAMRDSVLAQAGIGGAS